MSDDTISAQPPGKRERGKIRRIRPDVEAPATDEIEVIELTDEDAERPKDDQPKKEFWYKGYRVSPYNYPRDKLGTCPCCHERPCRPDCDLQRLPLAPTMMAAKMWLRQGWIAAPTVGGGWRWWPPNASEQEQQQTGGQP